MTKHRVKFWQDNIKVHIYQYRYSFSFTELRYLNVTFWVTKQDNAAVVPVISINNTLINVCVYAMF